MSEFQFTEGRSFPLNAQFNNVGGNLPLASHNSSFSEIAKVLRRQTALTRSEFNELYNEGYLARNELLFRDGLADVIVTADGIPHRLGYNYPESIYEAEWYNDSGLSVKDLVQAELVQTDVALSMLENAADSLEKLGQLDENQVSNLPVSTTLFNTVGQAFTMILLAMHSMARALQIDLQQDQITVYESNMSKFTRDEEEAARGVAKYAAVGVPAAVFPTEVDGETFYVVKCTAEAPMVGQDGGDYAPGKILKGVSFHKPKWTESSDASKVLFAELFEEVVLQEEAGE